MFSLLYQTAVFSSQVRTSSLDLTDEFFDLEDAVEKVINLINTNGGFTVSGWYKRGNIKDKTILFQNNNHDNAQKFGSNVGSDDNDQVDNSKIIYHPCIIKPKNPVFFDAAANHDLYTMLNDLKYDVSN